jgi:hypothetical protein
MEKCCEFGIVIVDGLGRHREVLLKLLALNSHGFEALLPSNPVKMLPAVAEIIRWPTVISSLAEGVSGARGDPVPDVAAIVVDSSNREVHDAPREALISVSNSVREPWLGT